MLCCWEVVAAVAVVIHVTMVEIVDTAGVMSIHVSYVSSLYMATNTREYSLLYTLHTFKYISCPHLSSTFQSTLYPPL